MKKYLRLTKFGIVFFVLLTATGGYLIGYPLQNSFSFFHYFLMILSLYFLSSGSFALNQYQERDIDQKMPRTQSRPLPSGQLTPFRALLFSLFFIILGLSLSFYTSYKLGLLGLVTLFLYNYFYTLLWKPRMAFAAVPGALPGAMPFAMGYATACNTIFTLENAYFFLVMFFWQMPHFWSIALRYREDYAAAGIPVLPTQKSLPTTRYYVGLYTFAYLALALMSPFMAPVGWTYFFITLPLVAKILWELFVFLKNPLGDQWLGFFLWTTVSVLVFICGPALDRWVGWFL